MRIPFLLLTFLLNMALLTSTPAAAVGAGIAATDPGDALIGDWLVESRDATIRIYGAGSGDDRHYDGRIVWLKDDHYHDDDGPELAGKPVMDLHNPEADKRQRPLLGLPLLWDLRYKNGEWSEGRVYNADNGHSYRCTIRLIDADHLRLRGYLGIPLLGGSTTWTRVKSSETTP